MQLRTLVSEGNAIVAAFCTGMTKKIEDRKLQLRLLMDKKMINKQTLPTFGNPTYEEASDDSGRPYSPPIPSDCGDGQIYEMCL